jgi:voltage-gated potassium channel
MTTVGYGDIYPTTEAGRAIAITVMVVGIGFVAVLTAAIAERFLAAKVEQAREEMAEEVESAEADVLHELQEITARLHALEHRLGRSA